MWLMTRMSGQSLYDRTVQLRLGRDALTDRGEIGDIFGKVYVDEFGVIPTENVGARTHINLPFD